MAGSHPHTAQTAAPAVQATAAAVQAGPAAPTASARRRLRVALAGNPNSGKTTLFNLLTGSHQHVGNYPGVTVEKKEGACRRGHCVLHVTDLPGTYSLAPYAEDERVARDFLLGGNPLPLAHGRPTALGA